MKTQIIRLITLLIFASVAISSCSVEYRERHRRHNDDHHDRDHDHDHHYRNY
jgi:ABC-type Zn2+ transport system substrate-binding protein/surface adhesin